MMTVTTDRAECVVGLVRDSARGLSTHEIAHEASKVLGLSPRTIERCLVPAVARMRLIQSARVGSAAVWMLPEAAQAWAEGQGERDRAAERVRNLRKLESARQRRAQADASACAAGGSMVQRVVSASATTAPQTTAVRSVFEWAGMA